MRRSRKKRSQLSVSLFPFLAVLICTLGVLIVMLVMAVKSADVQAEKTQADDDQQNLEKINQLQDAIDFRELQIEGLTISRPDIVMRLNESRANRSYLEDEIRKLKREFQRVGEELLELDQAPEVSLNVISEFSQSEADAEIRELEVEIVSAEEKLKDKRESLKQSGPSKYVIVPHKGGGGTFRRPIYLECTAAGITLQPSGILLETNEFASPLEPGNMLDSALLSIREYWQRYDLAGKYGSPYPLIVVRPDGAETFVLARRAMKSWDDEFGYELVESDKSLDFGDKDPQLDVEVKDAIEEARHRQRLRLAALAVRQNQVARFNAPVSRPGLTASHSMGGFVSSPTNAASSGSSWASEREQGNAMVGSGTSLDHFRNRSDRMASNRSAEEASDADDRSFASQKSDSDFQPDESNQFNASPNQSGTQSSVAAQGGEQAGNSKVGNPYAEQSLAKQRGTNWALPTQTPGATGYLRPIRVICTSDYLDVVSNSGSSKRIPLSLQTQQSVDPLIEEIWKQIESWGISGANSFWKPQLRFTIQDGGRQRYAELRGLLDQSGLVIEELRR